MQQTDKTDTSTQNTGNTNYATPKLKLIKTAQRYTSNMHNTPKKRGTMHALRLANSSSMLSKSTFLCVMGPRPSRAPGR